MKSPIWDPVERNFVPDPLDGKLTYLGDGQWRRGYRSKNGKYVIKLPTCDTGARHNAREAQIYKQYVSGKMAYPDIDIRFARCRLGPRGILLMEYTKPIFVCHNSIVTEGEGRKEIGCKPLPDWVELIDTHQVGINREGQIVAFDFGNK